MEYNDEELLYLTRGGCPVARDALYQQYYEYVKKFVLKMAITSSFTIDEDDYIQYAMLNLLKCFDSYRTDKKTMLKTFATMAIRNSLASKYRQQCLEYNRIFSNSISLDQPSVEGGNFYYDEIISDNHLEYQPHERMIIAENNAIYNEVIESQKSQLEKTVAKMKRFGYDEEEIADILGISVKAVYNATYRIQKKLSKIKLV